MAYLIEKLKLSGFGFHPFCCVESWERIDDKMSESDARLRVLDLATKIEKGKYRVRDIYSGKVLFEVST